MYMMNLCDMCQCIKINVLMFVSTKREVYLERMNLMCVGVTCDLKKVVK